MKDDNTDSQSELWRVVRAAEKERLRQNKAGIYKPADYYVWLDSSRDPAQPTNDMLEIIDALTKAIVECHDFRIYSESSDRIEGNFTSAQSHESHEGSSYVTGEFRFYKESMNPDDDRAIIFNILYDDGEGQSGLGKSGTYKICTRLRHFPEDAKVAFSLLGLIA